MTKNYQEKLDAKGIKIKPLADYTSARSKIPHECLKGHVWLAEPKRILEGRGCPICSGRRKKTNKEYLNQLADKSIKYTPIEEYAGTHIPILHKCLNGHVWKVRPSQILIGKGCPSCATYSIDLTKPAILYYIKISSNKDTYYKIGITTRSISDRFRDESNLDIIELYSNLFHTASEALEIEKSILSEFQSSRIGSLNLLKSGGNTELFNTDILGFDT